MTKLFRVLSLVLLLAPALAAPARAEGCSILLDVSGSMKGFVTAPNGQFLAMIRSLREHCPQLYLFGDPNPDPRRKYRDATTGPILLSWTAELSENNFNNWKTLLGKATEKWVGEMAHDGDAAIIITDNVADVRSLESDPEQKRLKAAVNQPFVKHLSVLPAVLPFSGTLFHPTDATKRYENYTQPRALNVYVLRVGENRPAFHALVEQTEHVLSAVALRMGHIDVRPLAEVLAPEFRLNGVFDDNKTTRIEAVPDVTGVLRSIKITQHPVEEEFQFGFDIAVRAQGNWDVNNVRVIVEFAPDAGESVDGAKLTKRVTSVAFYPKGRFSLRDGQTVPIHVTVTFNARNYYANADWWKIIKNVAFGDWSGHERAVVRLALDLKSASTTVAPDFKRDWSFDGSPDDLIRPDPLIQGRIYKLSATLENVVEGNPLTLPDEIPLSVEYLYPKWPFFAFLCFLLIVAGVLGTLLWMSKGARLYEIDCDGAATIEVSLAWFSRTLAQSGDGEARIVVARWPLMLWTTSSKRIVRGRLLSQGGGQVVVSSEPGGAFDGVMQRVAGMFDRRGRSTRDDDDDFMPPTGRSGGGHTWNYRIRAVGGGSNGVVRHDHEDI